MNTSDHSHAFAATAVAIVAVAAAFPNQGRASSDTAWNAFRQDVAKACRRAAEGKLRIEHMTVDPWGSTDYGLARLIGTPPDDDTQRQILCVYDKHSHAAQVGSSMLIVPNMPAGAS